MPKKRAVLFGWVQLFILGFCSSLLLVWIQANPPVAATVVTTPNSSSLPTLSASIAQVPWNDSCTKWTILNNTDIPCDPQNSQKRVVHFVPEKLSPAKAQLRNAAQILTKKGFEELNQGRASSAFQLWSESTEIYRQLSNQEGVIGSLVNQNLALQALGLYPQACKTLLQALSLDNWVCQTFGQTAQAPASPGLQLAENIKAVSNMPVVVTGLRHLGNVLRVIGKPNEAEIVLNWALTMANRLASTSDHKELLLSLANTERTLYNRARDEYERTDDPVLRRTAIKLLQQKARSALKLYRQVSNALLGDKQENTQKLAQLNRLGLLVELERWLMGQAKWGNSDLNALRITVQSQLQPLVEQLLLDRQFEGLSTIQSVYARLNLINSLIQINKNPELRFIAFQADKNRGINTALQVATEALQISRSVSDKRAESYALGSLGSLYRQTTQLPLSRKYFESALNAGQSVQAWDAVYQWQQQLGQIYQIEGLHQKAIEAYDSAISSLEKVRSDILSVNPDIQFDFKENVEPVYREYMRLLLSESNPNLQQVIETNERLKLAELENFLQCGKLTLTSLSEIQKSTAVPTTVYLISLGQQVEVIVRTPERSLYRHTLNINSIKDSVDNLFNILQSEQFSEIKEPKILPYSQVVYNHLLAPLNKYLPHAGTLIFVLDNYFQNLPIGILHDGQNYLVKTYNISIALSSQLRQPQVLKREQLRALVAGISKKSPSFNSPNASINYSPLPEVETEVRDVGKNITSTVELLNEEFTTQRFQQKIETGTFPLIHITTHGQFSSDPEKTILLAWDRAINVRQLNFLLRNRFEQDSIELLVLSACQTAKGDKRSALGIAGIAAQAGARSTLATLWLVDSASTAKLMGEFYKNLQMGLSKAEALRQAQLALWSHPKYQHPYYWAGFVLVGSWL